ncbi:MAG: undecaprenyl-diphosphate phosphatase [Siculibacillus sp.]|nr:undecaprenyl-diphosphate phosphatase [Siculibacillus sp.]
MATACTQGIGTGFIDLGTAKVAVLGAIQGITDVLPISSAAHMRIVPAVLGWADPGATFAAALQLATAVAIVAHYRRDVWRIGAGAFEAGRSGDYRTFEFRTGVGILLASLPLIVGRIAFGRRVDLCATPTLELWVLGAAGVAVAATLAIAVLVRRHERGFEEIRLRDAVALGLAQAFAVIPGVSRSGAALTGALLMNLKPVEAVRYGLLAGLPATVFIGLEGSAGLRRAGLDAQAWGVLGIGFLAATLAAWLAIRLLIMVMERFSAWPFVAYRAVVGGFLLLVVWLDVLA